jgi:hypothetical protein
VAAVHREEARRDLSWMVAMVKVDLRRRAVAFEALAALEDRDPPTGDTYVPHRAAVADAFGTARALVEYVALANEVFLAAFSEVGEVPV